MSIFGRRHPPTLDELTAAEIRDVVCEVFVKHGVDASRIAKETKRDQMRWYRIRSRNYGESGSRFGVAELIGSPAAGDPNWPSWIKLIPAGDLERTGIDLWSLARDRQPPYGYEMEEENRRAAACQFAGQLLSRLCEAEAKSRSQAGPGKDEANVRR